MNEPSLSNEVAVVVPAYGRHAMTSSVVRQLRNESQVGGIYVVDSLGSYQPVAGEDVIRPAARRRWAAACNDGMRAARTAGYAAFCVINNDVTLSVGFLDGLARAWKATGAGLVAPAYDHSWRHQWPVADPSGLDARQYVPRDVEIEIPFADGTCLLIPRTTLDRVGFLDETTWPLFGWGCDQDLALRARLAGLTVVVTYRAYLNHAGRRTARLDPEFSEGAAQDECDRGMVKKWGSDWRDRLFVNFPHVSRPPMTQPALDAKRA